MTSNSRQCTQEMVTSASPEKPPEDVSKSCPESEDEDCFPDSEIALINSEPQELNEASSKLLTFMEMVTADIQRYFGAKKRAEDLYENHWDQTKSGKELYYSHLIKIAQGSEEERSRNDSSGKLDKRAGLGPFRGLFEHGLKDYWSDPRSAQKLRKLRKYKSTVVKCVSGVPFNRRGLPDSFWIEPKPSHDVNNGIAKTLDFSDLLESWAGEDERQMDM